jgi:hypothetical protein
MPPCCVDLDQVNSVKTRLVAHTYALLLSFQGTVYLVVLLTARKW